MKTHWVQRIRTVPGRFFFMYPSMLLHCVTILILFRYIFIAGAYSYQVALKYTDRFYTPMPLYHTAAGIMCIGQSLLYGCTVVIRKKFSATGYFQDVSKYNCTVSVRLPPWPRAKLGFSLKRSAEKRLLSFVDSRNNIVSVRLTLKIPITQNIFRFFAIFPRTHRAWILCFIKHLRTLCLLLGDFSDWYLIGKKN